ncbi:hypothetical protein N7462_002334 [Penicillium macrosclerotiorum]|uniref:uncharacterized protein n=1 Tax=Penicillium macrosclerotiorum TaxID=303699 RepID=UPI002547E9B9|nr:uncharacterized protein N7462_002334 [Penicillium macrosclerotiorum]KAJ5692911.1 hypothetical protein N7462_002334 [Penicillium macrosclerotiorum]
MGIPGLINAIGTGERISLAKLAVSHLERTARPIRVAVDISIWLFQVQASRGGKNPELRTLFYRLLKLLALPIHPLFVYDGHHKPPFKRGKAISSRSYGNAPIIRRSKDLIERFRFPWHEAPGEAEAECARLQQAGVVDAVMSNDVDALMFGSTMTIMNFSKESGSGTSAATHVTCYHMGRSKHLSNVPLDRAGMILFAMLSGGDYLPSGVPKCGSKLAAEIAKAQFGDDLLKELGKEEPDLDARLTEWRERLQYELDENESGWFSTKHKAVRIPETFPDRTILEYYAEPKVSTEDELATLRSQLRQAWDREIDPQAVRSFVAEYFEWNYRSGARKVIKLLAEPLVSYRLRLQKPILGVLGGSLAPSCDTPWFQKVYRCRTSFGTDGQPELQMDILPIDVEIVSVQDTSQSGVEEEDQEAVAETPQTPSKTRVTKRYDPYAIEKVWIFESVLRLGVPGVVKNWEDEQAEKARKAAAPKKSTTRRTGPKKKGPIDPGMKRGSILKYGTLTKERSELSAPKMAHMLEATASKSRTAASTVDSHHSPITGLDDPLAPSMYSQQDSDQPHYVALDLDELTSTFSSLCTMSSIAAVKRQPLCNLLSPSLPKIEISYLISEARSSKVRFVKDDLALSLSRPQKLPHAEKRRDPSSHSSLEKPYEVEDLEKSIDNLKLSTEPNIHLPKGSSSRPLCNSKPNSRTRKYTARRHPQEEFPKPQESDPKEVPHHDSKSEVKSTILSAPCGDDPSPSKHESSLDTSHISNLKPKISRESQDKNPISEQAKGYVENIVTSNGFWAVGTAEDDMLVSDTGNNQSGTGTDTQARQRNKGKKRVPRVSVLDLI